MLVFASYMYCTFHIQFIFNTYTQMNVTLGGNRYCNMILNTNMHSWTCLLHHHRWILCHLHLNFIHVKSVSVFPPRWPTTERRTACDVKGLSKETWWARDPGKTQEAHTLQEVEEKGRHPTENYKVLNQRYVASELKSCSRFKFYQLMTALIIELQNCYSTQIEKLLLIF